MWIYKILRVAEWAEFQRLGVFAGSVDDQRDGFIHFSTRTQLQGTLDKHYANEGLVVIVAVDPEILKADLKWEKSRGGMDFPHLYASLPNSSLNGVWQISKTGERFDLAALDVDA